MQTQREDNSPSTDTSATVYVTRPRDCAREPRKMERQVSHRLFLNAFCCVPTVYASAISEIAAICILSKLEFSLYFITNCAGEKKGSFFYFDFVIVWKICIFILRDICAC